MHGCLVWTKSTFDRFTTKKRDTNFYDQQVLNFCTVSAACRPLVRHLKHFKENNVMRNEMKLHHQQTIPLIIKCRLVLRLDELSSGTSFQFIQEGQNPHKMSILYPKNFSWPSLVIYTTKIYSYPANLHIVTSCFMCCRLIAGNQREKLFIYPATIS